MEGETALTPWEETIGRRLATAQSTQLASGQPGTSTLTTRPEFAIAVGPALALVAPTGMSQDERKTWLGAAHKALAHLDCDTLARASSAAMLKADHPSKLVPLIAAEAERLAQGYRPISTIERPHLVPAEPETPQQRAERQEVGAMMKRLVADLKVKAA